ncbi:MAG: glycosyltransferase family 2 protein [Thermoanaerobaculia bacterium]|nr:glycosyltransferase family 2 protein [Thermoanaerobaculia bacterium]
MSRRYDLFVAARGNVYMRELAEQVREGIAETGREAALHLDGEPEVRNGAINLVVAPHEFFPLHPTLRGRALDRALAASLCLNTEQPGTAWFEVAARLCRAARGALDLNPLGHRELARRGIPARRLRLGFVPSLDRWGGRGESARDVDLVFLGGKTPRREALLASLARVLWPYRCRILLFENDRPAEEGRPGFLTGDAKRELFARARFLLLLHRGEAGYFDWLRGTEAMANGCVLVTEQVLAPEPLVAWRHFAEVPGERLGEHLAALLVDEPRRRAMAAAAYELVRGPLGARERLGRLLDGIEADAGSRPPRRPLRLRAAALGSGVRRAAARLARRAIPPAGAGAEGSNGGFALRVGAVAEQLKDAMLQEMAHRRRLEGLLCMERHGTVQRDRIWSSPSFAGTVPDVSVVVTLYNYEEVVEEALASVAASVGVVPEVVGVDDHSRARSRERVRGFAGRHPGLALELVERAANAGLPAARNLGFARARAPFVFVLDADNRIFPTALARLREALVAGDAAFAYGPVAKFGGEPGLFSDLPWDPERLARENYIDAMALVRRTAWEALGGYREDLALYGWEDYDFWLRAAHRGLRGALVPEILCEYRTHATSMIGITNIETRRLRHRFRDEYPSLYVT